MRTAASQPFQETLLSVNEACEALGIGRTFFYQLVKEKRIKVVKLGRRSLVSSGALQNLILELIDEAY